MIGGHPNMSSIFEPAPTLTVAHHNCDSLALRGEHFLPICQYPVSEPFEIYDGEVGAIVKLGRGGEVRKVAYRVIHPQ